MNQNTYKQQSFLKLLGMSPLLLALSLSARGCMKANEGAEKKTESAEKTEPGKDAKKDEHKDEVKLKPDAVAKYGIKVEAVKRQILMPTVLAPARVSFNTEAMAHVGAVLRGRVVELKVRKGDDVKRGQELLVVESPELGEAQSDYLQKRTAAEIAGPSVELAKSAYDRAKTLYDDSKGITLTELQKREVDYRTAQGGLQSAESMRTASENKLHLLGMSQAAVDALTKSKEITPRYPITAPIDGQVTEREVTLGELVNPDKEALLVLADIQTLWVLADVPEARLGEIAVGSPARVTVFAVGTDVLQAKVSFIDQALDPATRTARLRIELPNKKRIIRPGMFAQAEISATASAEHAEPVLAVPDEAIQTMDGGPVVFVPVKGEDNTFAKHSVTIGKAVGGMVHVLSGLNEGDPIVIVGSFILKADLGKSEAKEE